MKLTSNNIPTPTTNNFPNHDQPSLEQRSDTGRLLRLMATSAPSPCDEIGAAVIKASRLPSS